MKLTGKNGFSLLEVMVAVALIGGISVGVMKTLEQSTRVSRFQAESTESDQIVSKISAILRDHDACMNTFMPPAGAGASDPVTNPNVATYSPLGTGVEITEIRDEENKVVLRAGCAGDMTPCTFGVGGGKILLKTIKIMKFGDGSAPWNNAGDQASLFLELIKGGETDPDSLSDKDKEVALRKTIGQLVINRKVNLGFKLDPAKLIIECISEQVNFLSGACGQFRGSVDTDKRCKNITIETANTDPALSTTGDVQVVGDANILETLNIGRTPPTNLGIGNVNAGEEGYLKGNVTTQGEVIFTSDVNNSANYHAKILAGTSNNTINLYGKNQDRAVIKFGTSGTGASITGRNSNIGIGITPGTIPGSKLEVNGDLTVQGNSRSKQHARVGFDGASGSYLDLGGNVRLTHISNNALEFQGANVSISPPYNGSSSSGANLMATQSWVLQQFLDKLGDQAISEIMNNLLNNVTSDSRVKAVKANICNSIKNAVWNGSQCLLNGKNSLCSNTYLMRGFNSDGSVNCATKYKPSSNCGSYQMMYGVNTNGTIRCVDWRTIMNGFF